MDSWGGSWLTSWLESWFYTPPTSTTIAGSITIKAIYEPSITIRAIYEPSITIKGAIA